MKIKITLLAMLLSISLFAQDNSGYWDKTRSTIKEINLAAGARTWHRVDVPTGTTQVLFRITLIETDQQVESALVDLLNAVPNPYTNAAAAATTLMSAISGDDKCRYFVFLNNTDANDYIQNGQAGTACYKNPDEINKDVIFLQNDCVGSNPTDLYFAFHSTNIIEDERIYLEVVPWVDNKASRGWTKEIKENFIKNCISAEKDLTKAEDVCECVLDKLQTNYKVQDVQNMASSEVDKITSAYMKSCLDETGETANLINKIRSDANTLALSGNYGDAILKMQTVISSGTPTIKDYNSIGWYYLVTKQYLKASKYLKDGEKLDDTDLFIKGNLAHSYLLGGDVDMAKTMYLKYKGQNIDDKRSWYDGVKGDFDSFKKLGITHPEFDNILAQIK